MTYTDHSGTIAVANTSQLLCAANPNRRFLLIEPHSNTVWIDFGTAAVSSQPSIQIPQDTPFILGEDEVSEDAVYIIASDTYSFTCKEA